MKYIPHSRHGSLLLSGLDEIAHKHGVAASLSSEVVGDAVSHVKALEDDPESDYKTENGKITTLFYLWIQALDQGETEKAKEIEARIDESVKDHPFPYAETKEFYLYSTSEGYPLETSYDYALTNYRDCEKAPWNEKKNFGQIEGTVSANAKIGIIGDWGTGTDDAAFLLEELLTRAPDVEVILHLGDIYQCGTPFECAQNFLDPINAVFEKKGIARAPVFTIPGNHEYYTGAKGYFELLEILNSDLDPKWKQDASYFCLRSEDGKWQFLGADTGLGCINHQVEPGLEASELAWHQKRLGEFGGKSIFMTHHQFVSAEQVLNDDPTIADSDIKYFNKRLLAGLGGNLSEIDLWIWGHDHWFLPYAPGLEIPNTNGAQVLKNGQLLGGSARETKIKKRNADSIQYQGVVVEKDGQPIIPGSNDGLTDHTYGLIDLSASTVSYYEVGAWEGSTPNKTAPDAPLYVVDL